MANIAESEHSGRARTAGPSIAIAVLIASGGYVTGALTRRGAVAASFVGSSIIQAFGARGTLLLGAFFASGSGLSRLPVARAMARGSLGRNERQVVANGGVAALAGVGSCFLGRDHAIAVLTGSLAAATSDTWATEIGLQSGRVPRYLLNGRRVTPGLSGGVTPAGTLASVAGAVAISTLAGLLYRDRRLALAGTMGGLAGSILDSLLGELIQVKWRSQDNGELTDSEQIDGGAAIHASGWTWVDNDVVNLACTLVGGSVALFLWVISRNQSEDATSASVLRASDRPSS